jgi:dTDP-4-dehydrorhamnose 3,5-epimerase
LQIQTHSIAGLLELIPNRYVDRRGAFEETWNAEQFHVAVGRAVTFVQDNQSVSNAGVLRGLHLQVPPFAQGKLVRVAAGAALDVAVDLRRGSPTYGQHQKLVLSAENGRQLWIPPGFAHGFLSLENATIFCYKCTARYDADAERSIRWDDVALDIDWSNTEFGLDQCPQLSEKDAAAPLFEDFHSPFNFTP